MVGVDWLDGVKRAETSGTVVGCGRFGVAAGACVAVFGTLAVGSGTRSVASGRLGTSGTLVVAVTSGAFVVSFTVTGAFVVGGTVDSITWRISIDGS